MVECFLDVEEVVSSSLAVSTNKNLKEIESVIVSTQVVSADNESRRKAGYTHTTGHCPFKFLTIKCLCSSDGLECTPHKRKVVGSMPATGTTVLEASG